MKKGTVSNIENKALAHVPQFVWSFAGVSVVFTVLLMTNGIHIGQHLNDLMDIYIEEKRLNMRSKSELEIRILKLEKVSHKSHAKKAH